MSSTDILDVADKHTVVTGGNIGLGFRTSLELAANGARSGGLVPRPFGTQIVAGNDARVREIRPKSERGAEC